MSIEELGYFRLDGPEIPQNILEPHYWDGHSLDDNCPQRPQATLFKEKENRIAAKFAEDTLKLFIAIGQQVAVRTFKEGEEFDAHRYSPGTVIRTEQEVLRGRMPGARDERAGELYYVTMRSLGVVYHYQNPSEGEGRVIIVCPEQYAEYFPDDAIFLPTRPVIRIGQVDHNRWQDNAVVQSISRFTWIELLQFGKGIPEIAKEQQLSGNLISEQAK